MAMEATHIRFAMDLEDELEVRDKHEYYCGCIYPDSRYTTGVDRDMTHKGAVPSDPYQGGLSDFEKGWATHVLYDKIGKRLMDELISTCVEHTGGFDSYWCRLTAMKVVEDMVSCKILGEKLSIFCELTIACPLDEERQKMDHYQQMQIDLYSDVQTPEAYQKSLLNFIPDKAAAREVVRMLNEILDDDETCKKIRAVYGQVLDETRSSRTR